MIYQEAQHHVSYGPSKLTITKQHSVNYYLWVMLAVNLESYVKFLEIPDLNMFVSS